MYMDLKLIGIQIGLNLSQVGIRIQIKRTSYKICRCRFSPIHFYQLGTCNAPPSPHCCLSKHCKNSDKCSDEFMIFITVCVQCFDACLHHTIKYTSLLLCILVIQTFLSHTYDQLHKKGGRKYQKTLLQTSQIPPSFLTP